MWNTLPFDVLAKIFSFLSPDSLARAKSTCRSWHESGKYLASSESLLQKLPWFLAFPNRNRSLFCYAYNPGDNKWFSLPLDFLLNPVRPISHIGSLILLRLTSTSTNLQLAICNIFTRKIKHLPITNATRTNPAIGVIPFDSNTRDQVSTSNFKVYVAGGMSDGALYEPAVEMYDSSSDKWKVIGVMPLEFAVRVTVWTPSECVYSNGILYWLTSARVYSLIGFEINTSTWRELSVPMANRLEFAALVPRNGKLTLLGGKCGGDAYIWELGEGDRWVMIERIPLELGMKFLGGKGCWDGTKCAGAEGVVCLYRDLGSGRLVWREVLDNKSKWEWLWIEGCCEMKGNQLQNCQIKGLLLHPNLAISPLLDAQFPGEV